MPRSLKLIFLAPDQFKWSFAVLTVKTELRVNQMHPQARSCGLFSAISKISQLFWQPTNWGCEKVLEAD